MILLSRLNGQQIALNADLIERAEATPDTVLTLVDGTKHVVRKVSRKSSTACGTTGPRCL